MRVIVSILKFVAVVVVVLVVAAAVLDEDDLSFLTEKTPEMSARECVDLRFESLVALATEFPEWEPAYVQSALAEAREAHETFGSAEGRWRIELEGRAIGQSAEQTWSALAINLCLLAVNPTQELDRLRAQRELRGGRSAGPSRAGGSLLSPAASGGGVGGVLGSAFGAVGAVLAQVWPVVVVMAAFAGLAAGLGALGAAFLGLVGGARDTLWFLVPLVGLIVASQAVLWALSG